MSDRDMLFGGDPFGGDDDDPFGSDDDLFGGDDDLGWESEDELGELGEIALGDEETPDFGEEFGVPEDEIVAGAPTIFGLNRTFAIVGAFIALVVCVGIIGLVVVIQSNAGPSDVQLTVTSVYATNTYVAYALDLTETQNAINADLTATAASWTDTPTPTPTHTATPMPSPTVEQATQVALIVTPTLIAGAGLDVSAIELTATALAEILSGAPGGVPAGGATPTAEVGAPGTGPGLIVTPTPFSSLPDSGLFDEGFANGGGVNGLLTAALAALGLTAIIVVSRRLRSE